MTTLDESAQAQRIIADLRKQIAQFQRLRTANNEVVSGIRQGAVPWGQAREVAQRHRDAAMERHAVECLRQVIQLLRGDDAPPVVIDASDPLPAGIENSLGSLGVFWVPVAITAAGGAAYSAFAFLRAREERIMVETRGPVATFFHQLGENVWALAALSVVGLGTLIYFDRRRSSVTAGLVGSRGGLRRALKKRSDGQQPDTASD